MEYYGFTEEQFNRMIALFNQISVTGINQADAFHEATNILRQPAKIKVNQEEVKEDGKEIRKG